MGKAAEYSVGSRNVLWWRCDEAHRCEKGMLAPSYPQTIKQWVAHGCKCRHCYEEAQYVQKRDRRQQKAAAAKLKQQALTVASAAVPAGATAPAGVAVPAGATVPAGAAVPAGADVPAGAAVPAGAPSAVVTQP